MRRGNRSEDIRVEISSCIVASERREKDENTREEGARSFIEKEKRDRYLSRGKRSACPR